MPSMPARLTLATLALTLCVLAASLPAHAQLGTASNVPPQHLFATDHPTRLDATPDTTPDRRARLAQLKRTRAVRHSH